MKSDPPITLNQDTDSVNTSGKTKYVRRFSLLSLILFLMGAVLIIWGSNKFIWENTEKLVSKFCLIFAIGVAFILNGFLSATNWKKFAFWTGLALIGQATSLQMINAGQTIHFQHYYSINEIYNNNFLTLILLFTQIIFVTSGIWSRSRIIIDWLIKTISWWKLLIILVFLFFAGAAVTRDISIYFTSLLTAFLIQLINIANIILIAFSIPNESRDWIRIKFEQILGEEDSLAKPKLDKFALILTLWVVCISALLTYFVYQRHPHVPDETLYIFQAKYMAEGELMSKAPPVPEAFSVYMIPTQDTYWYSIFPPAWSALLALGMKINLEWLINPILAGICVLLSYIFFQDFYSRRFARISVFLLCCSPWFIFMAMSFMSHIFTLVCALGAAVLLSQSFKKTNILFSFLSGLFIGILSLIRPLDGAMVAVLLGVWTLISCLTWKSRVFTSLTLVVGTITTASLVFPYNKSITGNAFLLPMDAYYAKYFWKNANSFGFGSDRGMGWALDAFPGHSPVEAVLNAALNTFSINIELFGWSIGSLLLIVLFLVFEKPKRKDIWAFSTLLMVILGYCFFWYHGGPDFGARYWFLVIIPLIALTARGIESLNEKTNFDNQIHLNPRILLCVITLCCLSLISYFPWRSIDKYYHYLGMQPDIRELAKQNNFGKSLILIRGNEHPDYQSAWVYNPTNFEGDVPIYAWDKNPEIRNQLLKSFADRKVWIIDGPSITNNGYKIAEGPYSVEQLQKIESK